MDRCKKWTGESSEQVDSRTSVNSGQLDKCNSAVPRLHLVVEDEAGGERDAGVHRLLATIQLYCTVEESVGGCPASVVCVCSRPSMA